MIKHPLAGFTATELEATVLRHPRRYAVRPIRQLGTCGYYPRAWTVQYITADSPSAAIRKALR